MAMQAHEIEELIIKAFPNAVVRIEDMAGDGDHYSCFVESKLFAGKHVFNNIRWCIKL